MGSESVAIPAEASPGVVDQVRSLVGEGRELLYDHMKLAALEAKQAGSSLVTVIVSGVVIAVLLLSVWLGLMGAGVLFVVEKDWLMGSTALAVAVGINLLIIAMLAWIIVRQIERMKFAATTRSIKALLAKKSPTETA